MSDSEIMNSALGITLPEDGQYQGYELTINISHLKAFTKHTSFNQKLTLANILTTAINLMKKDGITILSKPRITYEFTQRGIIHLHGYLKFNKTVFTPAIVQDTARYIIKAINLKLKSDIKYDQDNYKHLFLAYHSPAVTINYTDTKQREQEWFTYMDKAQ